MLDILTTLQICSITIGAQSDTLTVFASIAMGKIKVFFVKIQIILDVSPMEIGANPWHGYEFPYVSKQTKSMPAPQKR